jgi:hypothetical protein
LQLPLQQSLPKEQDPPLALQHVFAVPHVRPAQQSPVLAHDTRRAEHPQWPAPLQTPVQQSDATLHAVPSAMQPHVFSELQSGGWAVAQQSLLVVHPVPAYPQPHVLLTVLQIVLQQSDGARHEAPSPEHTTSTTH